MLETLLKITIKYTLNLLSKFKFTLIEAKAHLNLNLHLICCENESF